MMRRPQAHGGPRSSFNAAVDRLFSSPFLVDMASEGFVGIDLTGVSYVQGVFSPAGPLVSSGVTGNNRRIEYGVVSPLDLAPQNNYEGMAVGAAGLLAATAPGSSNPNFIALNWAEGGFPWVDFAPGSTRYNNSLGQWSANLVGENITRFMNVHGLTQYSEVSNGVALSTVVADNIAFFDARVAALAALTGQGANTISKTHFAPGWPPTLGGVAQTNTWGLAIEAMCDENRSSGYFCPGTLHILSFDPTGDLVHPTVETMLWKNELYGKFLRQVHLEGVRNWTWMRMQSAVASGNDVIVTVNVPALERGTAGGGSPVVFDSSGIIAAGVADQGFRYVANGGPARSITNVALGSQQGTNFTIVITLDGPAPTSTPVDKVNGAVPAAAGAYIGYADYGNAPFDGTGGVAGVPRGYVRDSETVALNLASTITVNGVTPGSWNWLVNGQQQIVA